MSSLGGATSKTWCGIMLVVFQVALSGKIAISSRLSQNFIQISELVELFSLDTWSELTASRNHGEQSWFHDMANNM